MVIPETETVDEGDGRVELDLTLRWTPPSGAIRRYSVRIVEEQTQEDNVENLYFMEFDERDIVSFKVVTFC